VVQGTANTFAQNKLACRETVVTSEDIWGQRSMAGRGARIDDDLK